MVISSLQAVKEKDDSEMIFDADLKEFYVESCKKYLNSWNDLVASLARQVKDFLVSLRIGQ